MKGKRNKKGSPEGDPGPRNNRKRAFKMEWRRGGGNKEKKTCEGEIEKEEKVEEVERDSNQSLSFLFGVKLN